ncbi:hypothetical protein ACWCPK_38425 [Streptomyces sp. NPDC001953]
MDTLTLTLCWKGRVSMQAAAPRLRERKKTETYATLRAAAVRLLPPAAPAGGEFRGARMGLGPAVSEDLKP